MLQEHLFEHLWLLDASWERAAVGGRMEENLREVAPGLFATAGEARRSRDASTSVTPRWAVGTSSLSSRGTPCQPDVVELKEQGLKYYNALASVLTQQQKSIQGIEIVFVLGHLPRAAGRGRLTVAESIQNELDPINGRVVLYAALIANAEHQYADYLAASDLSRELDQLLDSLTTQVDSERLN